MCECQVLGGNWDPYPIDMSFLPPVMTFSTIGLNQPGKIERGVRCEDCEKHLHQLHVCLPAKPGHTRLLYRMSLDFMGWIQHVPGIQKVRACPCPPHRGLGRHSSSSSCGGCCTGSCVRLPQHTLTVLYTWKKGVVWAQLLQCGFCSFTSCGPRQSWTPHSWGVHV